MRPGSGPGAARTILLFHIISASPFKQPRMVGSTLGVYSVGLSFVSARTNKRYHDQTLVTGLAGGLRKWCHHSIIKVFYNVTPRAPPTGI